MMAAAWGVVVAALALLAWGGQTMSWLAPERAARWGLSEAEGNVDPAFWADVRGEARWDAASLWTMVAAGVLLVVDSAAWPYFGLVGGGIFLYFAGRGILTRRELARRRLRIGAPGSVQVAYAFLTVWGVMAAITIVAAVAALR